MRNPNYYANAGMPSPADYARAAERDRRAAMFDELVAALEMAASIIGHPDDAASQTIAELIAKAKAAP
jgi:hypothetical protein